MKLEIVDNKKTKRLFHKVPKLIYKDDKNWACPMDSMVEEIFDPAKNPSFRNGEAIRWILTDDQKNLLGRISAFVDYNKSKVYEQPTGSCGFFECVDDQKAADMLFDAARDWLKERGLEAMDGPVNFGENYVNWGLLVDGFMPQGYGMPYNPVYYQNLFETYGFKLYFKQFSYHLDYTLPFPERFWKIAEWVAKKPGYSFKHFSEKEADKFVQDFCHIYDEAWAFHENHKPLNKEDMFDFLKDAKAILDPEMLWFAYHDGDPIASFIMIPDVNQIFRRLNGKMNLLNILKFLYYKKKNVITRTRILVMGVVPRFQKSGIESAIFYHQDKLMKKKPQYKEVELSWAGDFNPKIISLYESVGGKHVKTHYTMRYLFDRNKVFSRAPIIGVGKK
ncbi:MAG: GNAT family N-acetyltransferase [Prolixibacteraceae bacterium]|nr:GNAT family N-acetyltransferase [Prolixibacteraceae bacterium]